MHRREQELENREGALAGLLEREQVVKDQRQAVLEQRARLLKREQAVQEQERVLADARYVHFFRTPTIVVYI